MSPLIKSYMQPRPQGPKCSTYGPWSLHHYDKLPDRNAYREERLFRVLAFSPWHC